MPLRVVSRLKPGARAASAAPLRRGDIIAQIDPRLCPAPPAEHVPDGRRVPVGTHARDHRIDRGRDDRPPPPLLPAVHVRQVYLDLGYIQRLKRVVERVGVVRPGTGVDDYPVGARRLAHEPDHLPLVIRLPELELDARELLPQNPLYVVEGVGP